MFDPDNLSPYRRDWLEVFGNQWGSRRFEPSESKMSADEKEALAEALNPFSCCKK